MVNFSKELRVTTAGNPGVGKSYILNALIGEVKFKSGKALTSVTDAVQEHKKGNVIYVDVPGLLEPVHLERNKKGVKDALTKDSNYLVLFVMTLQAGRVQYQDVEALKVLNAAYAFESKQLLLIFNKTDVPSS